MNAPDGFVMVRRGHGPGMPTEGFTALVTHRGINFSGAEVRHNREIGRADVAINGERFAVRRTPDGEYKIGTDGKAISSPRLARMLTHGRYVGRCDGEWWIFEPAA